MRAFPYHLLRPVENRILRRLDRPAKIQDYLERLPTNLERTGETCRSPRRMMCDRTAHCMEGALFGAAVLWYHRQPPLLLDLKTTADDEEHVVALFRIHGHWGAISKTNHAWLRYRDPVYKSVRELAMSYLNEYFLPNGKKTLRSFSQPFDLRHIKSKDWIISDHDLWDICDVLDESPHTNILSRSMIAMLRRADPIERKAGKLAQWKQ